MEQRLIDANALIKAICSNCALFCDKTCDGKRISCYPISIVSEQPTVDAAPVVHAHWRRYSYDEAICTHCGYDRWTDFECSKEADEKWDELPKYCEACGARMDGADGERRME